MRRWAGLALAAAALAVAPAAPAAARPGPPLSVPKSKLAAAFHCHGPEIRDAARVPLMLVTGTGATGEQAYAIGKGAFDAYGHPVCDVDFPASTTADIQVSVQYLVYGIRREARLAGRKVAVFGISQGALLPRFALTYWPGLRDKVGDVLAAAGTQHGTTVALEGACSAAQPCVPAAWQQAAGSHLLRALNRQPDETPGRSVGWTTVRSLGDETVQPQSGPHPTSALRGRPTSSSSESARAAGSPTSARPWTRWPSLPSSTRSPTPAPPAYRACPGASARAPTRPASTRAPRRLF
ncbi:MAG: hypothetical protein U0R52_13920 [Solirubrobacterales bacterium]